MFYILFRLIILCSFLFSFSKNNTDLNTNKAKLANFELVRLAIPRRTYTQSHIDYVVEVLEYINTIKDSIKGVRVIKQPAALRHFTAEFETVK